MVISPAIAARLGKHIARRTGLCPPEWVLFARVRERTARLGLPSVAAYADLVGSPHGAAELDVLVEALRVGETRFFRHSAQIQALTNMVVPALKPRRIGRVIQVWSAGCASGEEAYTLAMVLGELLPRPAYRYTVLATDISERALDIARRGEYPESAVATVPERFRDRAFVRSAAGYSIRKDIADKVQFMRENLLDSIYPGRFDLIWCRNVLIYFAEEARREVVLRLGRSLTADGALFVGYSESMRGTGELQPVRAAGTVFYCSPGAHLMQHVPPLALPAAGQVAELAERVTLAAASLPSASGSAQPKGSNEPREPRAKQPPVKEPPGPGPGHAPPVKEPPGPGPVKEPPVKEPPVKEPPAEEPPMSSQPATISLLGRYDRPDKLAAELAPLTAGAHTWVRIAVDGAELLDDNAAVVLRRAVSAARASGARVTFAAERPGPLRWLRRHGFLSDSGLGAGRGPGEPEASAGRSAKRAATAEELGRE